MSLGHQWKINLTLTIALLVLHCSFVTSQALQAVLVLVGGGVQPNSRCPWQSFTSPLHCPQKAVARWRPAGSQQPVSPSQVSSTAVSGSHLTDSFCFLFSCPRGRSVVISSYKQYPHFFAPQFIPFPRKTEGEKTRGEKKKKQKKQFAKQNVALGPINLDRNPRCWSCSWDWTRALTINRRGSGSLLVCVFFGWLVV